MLFTKTEFQRRMGLLTDSALELNLSAVIVFDDDRYIGGGGVRYFAGYRNTTSPLYPSAFVAATKNGTEPFLCIAPGLKECQLGLAERESWCKNISGTSYKMWHADYPKDIGEALTEQGVDSGKVGIDNYGIMNKEIVSSLQEMFPKIEFVNVTGLAEKTRLTKSKPEIALIEKAVSLSDLGITRFMKMVRSGKHHYQAEAEAEYAAKGRGAEETSIVMSGGKPWVWGMYRGDMKFHTGDMVAAEFNARVKGYYGQICRTTTVQRPTDSQKDIYSTTLEASKAMTKIAKEGVSSSELFRTGWDIISGRGYSYSGIRFGHGLGLTIAEGFDISEKDETKLQEGFYVMIHPSIVESKQGNGAIIGDPVLITKTGARMLSKAKHNVEATKW